MKAREAPTEVGGCYTCLWSDYYTLAGARSRFRLLTLAIANDAASSPW